MANVNVSYKDFIIIVRGDFIILMKNYHFIKKKEEVII